MSDHSGVLAELVAGTWREPDTGKHYDIGIQDIVIRDSLDGAEAELVSKLHAGKSISIISDQYTHGAIGERIFKALKSDGFKVDEYIWNKPVCSDEGVAHIREATRNCEVRIAVGSGTVSDTVKYASFLDEKPYSVFATSPMNAYTTATASVSSGGFKRSITCKGAQGIYFDLSVLAKCPPRLISAAFADVICRTTSQVDWLLSHLLFNTAYSETPYTLLAYDEADMITHARQMKSGDLDALAMLTRISAIMGLGTRFTGTTHSGSMAEHMISHYTDMFAGNRHPGTSHGEQVGVATVTMSLLQNQILSSDVPPVLKPTRIPEQWIRDSFDKDMSDNMLEQTRKKSLDSGQCDKLNEKLQSDWDNLRAPLIKCMLPFNELHSAMLAAGCQATASDLNLDTDFYKEAVKGARFIRDRYTMLDLVDDSVGLDGFVQSMPI
ncbi:MAG: iron-containing alcohol dehydrogenase [Granulosicoccus sp.]